MNLTHNGRELEIEFSGYGDDFEVTAAYYLDGNEEDLDDKTLDEVLDVYASKIDLAAFEKLAGAAEAYYEGDR